MAVNGDNRRNPVIIPVYRYGYHPRNPEVTNLSLLRLLMGTKMWLFTPGRWVASSVMFDPENPRNPKNGTMLSAIFHIIAATMWPGVLYIPWIVAQLGWVAGPMTIIGFSLVSTCVSYFLLHGSRHDLFGRRKYEIFKLLQLFEYLNLVAITIGHTIAVGTTVDAIKRRSNHEDEKGDNTGNLRYLLLFGIVEVILSELIKSFQQLAVLSIISTIMCFGYSSISFGLLIAKIRGGNNHITATLTRVKVGVDVKTTDEKVWNLLEAIGGIAFGYGFSSVLLNIRDTLNPTLPQNRVMMKASIIGIVITTSFYSISGSLGYAAFGNKAPGNLLIGFSHFWLVDIANLCIIFHLVGAYQVYCQPIFHVIEHWAKKKWPRWNQECHFVLRSGAVYRFNFFMLIWRPIYIIGTILIAVICPMIFPMVFTGVMGLFNAFLFWPLSLYFPIKMYIAQAGVRPFTLKWTLLQAMSTICLLVSIVAVAVSIRGVIVALKAFKPFQTVS